MNDALIWPPEALFFDRDGTLIKHIAYLSDPDRVELEAGVDLALSEAKRFGIRLFLHTNQSGIGRGYFDIGAAHACNRRLIELLDLGDAVFDEICIAPEDPTRDEPVYRKPEPRFANEMAEKYDLNLSRCYMIGDNVCDVETALSTGMIPIALWKRGDKPERLEAYRKSKARVFSSVHDFWTELKGASQA